jgi:hypothetical protein
MNPCGICVRASVCGMCMYVIECMCTHEDILFMHCNMYCVVCMYTARGVLVYAIDVLCVNV